MGNHFGAIDQINRNHGVSGCIATPFCDLAPPTGSSLNSNQIEDILLTRENVARLRKTDKTGCYETDLAAHMKPDGV